MIYCLPFQAACNVQECNGTSNCNFTAQAFETDGFVNHTLCSNNFADGFSDNDCNQEETLFDGFDHVFHEPPIDDCSPFFNTICTQSFNNKRCYPQCNTSACLWDGWDCIRHDSTPELRGGVVIEFKQTSFIYFIDRFLKRLMMLSRSQLHSEYNQSTSKPR